ncbi:MAG TPA: NAD(P)/FAD-dependent oxidoreductase [Pirellulaceae bacterium]|nr:NAD(P)/FAD-dependent oxidoreductase [Pirellulaceae bacterium]HMO93532.1 NAD(P)/FAD-dependent oxidoreductase [Pirellulaceae bacterium]HMP70356.1 NAD(P)/FAD-dependent oxidoreductase [Pirellulaceae bacterium]
MSDKPSEATDGLIDALVIGGGHNGLINAAYLAKAGLKTLVLESRPFVGGAAITEELRPGFKFTTFSYAISLLRPEITQDLSLVDHGLMILPLIRTFQPGYAGNYLLLGPDGDENYHEIARHSAADAEAYRDLSLLIKRTCFALKPLMDSIPPNRKGNTAEDQAHLEKFESYIAGLAPDIRAILDRFANSTAADILDEYFETDLLKAMLSTSGIIGSRVSPRTKGSGLVWLFHKMGEYDGVFGEWGFHKAGNGGFTQVLARAVAALGGTIRTNAPVASLLYENGEVFGVRLANGEEINAKIVVSSLDPRRTFNQLVRPVDLPQDLVDAINQYEFWGVASKVNFALHDLPKFPGLENRSDIYMGFTNICPTIDYIEEAYADCLAGRFSRRPFMDCCVQSTLDPDMSPAGKHVMSCFVMYTPYRLANGDWTTERKNLGDTVEDTLDEFFPGFRNLVIQREVVTPDEIERCTGLTEGDIFGGALDVKQMFFKRPAEGWNQYRTPIAGYYQCGSGTHPGGAVTGGPGKLAAQQILADLSKSRNAS